MTAPAVKIRLQTPKDLPALKKLNEDSFGPGRFARTAFRIREEAVPDPRLNLCAIENGTIIGSVLFTPVVIGGVEGALLLGPLIVEKTHSNQGHGLRLMLDGMARARDLGYALVILVGDLPYYTRAGFALIPPGRVALPGPVDPTRLLYAGLVPGALERYRGLARGGRPVDGVLDSPVFAGSSPMPPHGRKQGPLVPNRKGSYR